MSGGATGDPASVLDLFAYGCRTLIIMRTCVSCGDPIPEKKRKDAKYCDKAACRGREYRKRQAEAAVPRADSHGHHASMVLSCPCGRQYLLQVSELDPREPGTAPKLSSPPSAAPEALTQTVALTEQRSAETESTSKAAALVSEALTQTVALTEQRSVETASTSKAAALASEALTQTDRADQQFHREEPTAPVSTTRDLSTLEMYFTDGAERRIPFGKAVRRQSDGRWSLHPHAKLVFGFTEQARPCLGGKPGAWRKYYGARSPSEFGYDPDLVVMYWDHAARRGCVVLVGLLDDILGAGWKGKLRKIRDEKA